MGLVSKVYFTRNITPDQVVELSEEAYSSLYYGTLTYEEDVQLQTAVNYLRQKIS